MEIISSSSLPFETSKNSMVFGNFNLNSWEIFCFISSHILSSGFVALDPLAFGLTAFIAVSYSVSGSL